MAANYVSKGTNRPAAAARSRKHAQRTPLPPRPGQVEEARETPAEEFARLCALPLAEQARPKIRARIRALSNLEENTGTAEERAARRQANEETNARIRAATSAANQRQNFDDAMILEKAVPQYGRKTVAQLRDVAKKIGVRPLPTKRGDLLNAILDKEKELQAIEAQAREIDQAKASGVQVTILPARGQGRTKPTGPKPQKTAKKAPSAALQLSAGSTPSRGKAVAVAEVASQLGWSPEIREEGGLAELTVTRGAESIHLAWTDGVFTHPCTYSIGSRSILLRNASAAKQRMAMGADKAKEESERVATRRVGVPKSAPARKAKVLPFTEASLDQEVLDALYGRKITWTNRISGEEEVDYVPALADGSRGTLKQHHAPKIIEGPDGRVLNFVGGNGFRSVLISSIVRVGR